MASPPDMSAPRRWPLEPSSAARHSWSFVALGLGAVIFSLKVRLPRSSLLVFAVAPVLAGISLVAPVTPRWTGAALLALFRRRDDVPGPPFPWGDVSGNEEVEEAQ